MMIPQRVFVKRASVKRALLASVVLAALPATSARAADQSAAPHLPTKSAIVPPAAIYNWTGCYIGAQGGGGAVSDTFISTSIEGNANLLHGGGGFAGGQIGCNYQNGAMVLGLEGEAWSGLTNPEYATEPGNSLNRFTRNPWSADVAVRAGLAFDRALFYGKAGIAEGRFAFSTADTDGGFAHGASTLTGVLLGVGLEYGLALNWSAKLEYDHISYAGRTVHFDANSSAAGGPFDETESSSADLIKAGINYRFGAPSLPPVSDGTATHTGIFKAPVSKAVAPAAFSWTGCYAGLHGGGGWMRDTLGGDFGGGGGFAGGQIGCNLQTGAIVWGLEGEAAWSGLTDHFHLDQGAEVDDITTRNRWSADAATRAGVALDRTLLYGKAGLAAGRFEFFFTNVNPTDGQNGSATLAGLLVGGGLEYAVTPNWSVKLEYDHVDYFGRDVGFDTPFLGHILERQAAANDLLKLGVNYRFADVPFAPAADRAGPGPAIVKAPVYKAPAAASYWTGCYAGVHGGGGLLADPFVLSGRVDPIPQSSGGFAGGQLGCDYQTGALVWGLEGEAAWSRIIDRFDSSGALMGSFDQSSDLVWSADVAARAGVAIDRGLFYGKAGVAAGRFGFALTDSVAGIFENGATTLGGLLLGAGIEYALAPNWSVLLEYDRIAYAGRAVNFATSGTPPLSATLSATVNEAKAGINYRFGGAPLPPTASASQRLLPLPATDWTGCYAGVHAGGGIIDDTFVTPFETVTPSGAGAIAGGQVGCNLETGIMVFGLEGEAAWSGTVNRFAFSQAGVLAQSSDRNPWRADLAARTGIAFDRALLYGKVGAAAGKFDFSAVDNLGAFLQGSATLTGLLLGLGVEYAFAPNWSAKLEYDHVGYLSQNIDLGAQASTNESATTNTVKAGINYKFFGPSGVVVAKD
jgi:outer membrane immunogenic protein